MKFLNINSKGKTIVMILSMVFMFNISFGQEKYTSYVNRHYNKSYDISVYKKSNVEYAIYIEMFSLDKSPKKGGIIVESSKHKQFLNILNEVKENYKDWVNSAKEKNLTELDKIEKYEMQVVGYFQFGGKIQSDVNLYFDFKIIDGKYLLIIGTGKIASSSNEYIAADGFEFVFQNENEIDNMIDILSLENIKDFINKPKPIEVSDKNVFDSQRMSDNHLLLEGLEAYSERSKAGYTLIAFGSASVITANIVAQIQARRIINSLANPTNNPNLTQNNNNLSYIIPASLNYLGYGLILTGSIVKITSYKLLKKDVTVSVGINSVSVNF